MAWETLRLVVDIPIWREKGANKTAADGGTVWSVQDAMDEWSSQRNKLGIALQRKVGRPRVKRMSRVLSAAKRKV